MIKYIVQLNRKYALAERVVAFAMVGSILITGTAFTLVITSVLVKPLLVSAHRTLVDEIGRE